MDSTRTPEGMDRRAALRSIATGVGATASALWVADLLALADEQAQVHVGMSMSPQGATTPFTPKVLSPAQLLTVATVAELIIPTTETPGAKTALVDRFIDGTLESATPAARTQFMAGLVYLDERSQSLFQRSFVEASSVQQTDLLTRLSRENSTEQASGVQFFTAIKGMTITGYYSTEIGLRQELGDPGELMLPRFVGCTHPEHQS